MSWLNSYYAVLFPNIIAQLLHLLGERFEDDLSKTPKKKPNRPSLRKTLIFFAQFDLPGLHKRALDATVCRNPV